MRTFLYYTDKALEICSSILAYIFLLGVIPTTVWIATSGLWHRFLYVLATYFVLGGLIWFSEWVTIQIDGRDPYSYEGTDWWFCWFWMLVGLRGYLQSR